MPEVLILCRDNEEGFKLDELSKSRGVRSKYTCEIKTALSWLRLRCFDAAFVCAATPIGIQQEMAGLIWTANPMAPFLVYDLNDESKLNRQEVRLYGAELCIGKDAWGHLDGCLKSLSQEPPVSGKDARDNFRIMVVEDLDSPRDIICFFIESLGFPVVKGECSARDALATLESSPEAFSCILTDIRMPEISGEKLIELIRNHPKLQHLPIIVLTAHGTVDCLVDCLKAGASGFLVKPPKKQDLLREISRALRMMRHHASPRLINREDAELVRELIERSQQ